MAVTKHVMEVVEEQVQVVKRRTFKMSRLETTAVQDTVLALAGEDRKELIKLMALAAYNSAKSYDFQEGMKKLDELKQEMEQIIESIKKGLEEELPFH